MHPSIHAANTPDKPAYIMGGSGKIVTYRQLDEDSNRIAHLFRSLGLKRGDNVAILLPNEWQFYPVAWAAQRAGLYYTAISTRLTAGEVEYIAKDAGSKVLVTSPALSEVAGGLTHLAEEIALFMTEPAVPPFRDLAAAMRDQLPTPIRDESPGAAMLYSSGTTGRPKGVKHPLPEGGITAGSSITQRFAEQYGANAGMTYLSPAPLYHAAPLGWSMPVHRFGGTVVLMEHFDAEDALRLIEKHRVTHAQFVPTHFVRMLKLPADVRRRYDLSSLQVVFHAAAPCPVPIKQQMIDWLGPIVHEYYAGTESNGRTCINSEEWLAKKGSVGRPVASRVHICGPDGNELPTGEEGLIYFSGGAAFEYHNDAAKTAESRHARGWSTLGDIGRLDEDGYLFLTDRKSFMIISGGVNIYPQEIENLLVTHPKVADAAVVGAPDEDMGEKVVAVIQPMDMDAAGPALAEELRAFARAHLGGMKTPRQFDFMAELPRHATGKLYKRLLRDRYWGKSDSRIV